MTAVVAAIPVAAAQSVIAKPLSNGDVVALAKSGMGSKVIIAKIAGSPTAFDTSAIC